MAAVDLGKSQKARKHKWDEHCKVYVRKKYRKLLTDAVGDGGIVATTATSSATVSAAVGGSNVDNYGNGSGFVAEENEISGYGTNGSLAEKEVGRVTDEGYVPNVTVKQAVTRLTDRVRIDLKAASSYEINDVKETCVAELSQVRSLLKKVEGKEAQVTSYSTAVVDLTDVYAYSQNLGHPGNDLLYNGRGVVNSSEVRSVGNGRGNDLMYNRRGVVNVSSEVRSVGNERGNDLMYNGRGVANFSSEVRPVGNGSLRPFGQLSVSVSNNSHEYVEKEKRTPKENPYYRNSDFLLGNDRLPSENRRVNFNGGRKHNGGRSHGVSDQVFRNCSSLLQRLMKHKHGWVFNEPVNAKLLGLHDYHQIIKHPMDLGTIRRRLEDDFYLSPREFAEDVRLTFHNAMTYNPKGQDVHIMAEILLNMFEERWAGIESNYNASRRSEMTYNGGFHTPTPRKAAPISPAFQMRSLDRSHSMPVPFDTMPKPSSLAPVLRTPALKKPKAKDPNKRDMTFEEKQKLSTNLQSLPSDKLDSIVQIIKRRNTAVSQQDDEIEVDIDRVDVETLWELDRFFVNYKKSMSKRKRRAEIALQARAAAVHGIQTTNHTTAIPDASKENIAVADGRGHAAASIGQGLAQRESQVDIASRSCSSSSSSSDSGSSSSDSDSESSSVDGSGAGRSPRN